MDLDIDLLIFKINVQSQPCDFQKQNPFPFLNPDIYDIRNPAQMQVYKLFLAVKKEENRTYIYKLSETLNLTFSNYFLDFVIKMNKLGSTCNKIVILSQINDKIF